jgi:hypothetical protein
MSTGSVRPERARPGSSHSSRRVLSRLRDLDIDETALSGDASMRGHSRSAGSCQSARGGCRQAIWDRGFPPSRSGRDHRRWSSRSTKLCLECPQKSSFVALPGSRFMTAETPSQSFHPRLFRDGERLPRSIVKGMLSLPSCWRSRPHEVSHDSSARTRPSS